MRSDNAPPGAYRGRQAPTADAQQLTDDNIGIASLRWPEASSCRATLQLERRPRLLLVTAETAPPIPADELEDWTRSAVGSPEYEARATELGRRSRALLHDVSLSGRRLQRGSHAVTLTETQCLIVAALIRMAGRPVPRKIVADALAVAGAVPSAACVRSSLTRLDRAVAPLSIRVWLLSGRAVLLEVCADATHVHPYVTSTKLF